MVRQWYDFFAPDRVVGNNKHSWLGLVLIFSTALSWAAAPSPTSTLTPVPNYPLQEVGHHTTLKVGDALEFRIPGLPPQTKVRPPSEESGWDVEQLPSSLPTLSLRALPIKPGKLTLPALDLEDAQGNVMGHTEPFTQDVASAISPQDPQPEQPNENEPPVGLKFPLVFVIVLSLGVLALLAGCGYGAWRVWGRKVKPTSSGSEPDLRPEHEVAFRSLFELEKKGYLNLGAFKSHYFGISEIIKAYIGARFGIDARESTTRELMTHLTDFAQYQPEITDPVIAFAKKLFNQLDRVKFTDYQPPSEEASQIVGEARKFIEMTRRQPSVVERAGGDKERAERIARAERESRRASR